MGRMSQIETDDEENQDNWSVSGMNGGSTPGAWQDWFVVNSQFSAEKQKTGSGQGVSLR